MISSRYCIVGKCCDPPRGNSILFMNMSEEMEPGADFFYAGQ